MAKHIIGKTKSAGLRKSCAPLKRKAIIQSVQATRVGTAMHEAFLNINIANDVDNAVRHDIVDSILVAAKRNAGNNLVGRGWSANLQAKTVRQLTQEGVFA